MLDAHDLLKVIKKAAVMAVEHENPTTLITGKVVGVAPLKISLVEDLVLSTLQLILTRNVTDFTVAMTMDHLCEEVEHTHQMLGNNGSIKPHTHTHGYKGNKTFTVHNALTMGEEVVLIRMQGGQKYLVVDRVVNL